jgi:hypothetical protein
MKGIRIERFSSDFQRVVVPLIQFEGMSKNQSVEFTKELLTRFPFETLIIAIISNDERLLGFLIANSAQDVESVALLQLWTDPKLSQNNLPSQLMGYLTKWAETGKRRYVRLVTRKPDNYTPLGFTVEAFSMLLKLEREDEVLFEDESEVLDATDKSPISGESSVSDKEETVGISIPIEGGDVGSDREGVSISTERAEDTGPSDNGEPSKG